MSPPLTFDTAIDSAARAAAIDWGYPEPSEAFFAEVRGRLPVQLRAELTEALREGTLVIEGSRFRLRGLAAAKGPYALFSRNRAPAVPLPNWEYYVQIAEYARALRLLAPRGYEVGFEDGLMDVSVRRDGQLIWFIEVKEKATTLVGLLAGLERFASDVPLDMADRGNDPLRKAKYLVRHRPTYLSLAAIGARQHFAMRYPSEHAFELTRLETEPQLP